MAEWVVYTRDDCSLCERFQQDLVELIGAQAQHVRRVDIDGDPALEARYGHKIPVLAIDGDIVCMYRVDPDRVRAYL
jgi:hypothetical protein